MSMVQIPDREELRALLNVARHADTVWDNKGTMYVFDGLYWVTKGTMYVFNGLYWVTDDKVFPEELLNALPVTVYSKMMDRLKRIKEQD